MVNLLAAVAGNTEKFILNSFTANINPSILDSSKLYLKATEELLKSEWIIILLENGTVMRRYLKLYRTKFAWRLLLSKVSDNNS